MTDQEIKDLIDFFNNIEVEEKTLEENKNEGVLKVEVTYKLSQKFFEKDFKNFEFTTAELFYRDISKVEVKDVKDKNKVLGSFGSPVYWLDIDKHKWPAESEDVDIESIKNQISNGDGEFEGFLGKLYDNIKKITSLQKGKYGNNFVTNNHWHDIVNLFKDIIKNKGQNINPKEH